MGPHFKIPLEIDFDRLERVLNAWAPRSEAGRGDTGGYKPAENSPLAPAKP